MHRPLPILLLLLTLTSLRAQDIHFSQVDANPLLLNPAYAGFYDGAGRFGVIYRNQWATVSTPFQTFALTGEMALWRSTASRSGLSIGASLFSDHAGTLHYGTTSAHISLAYYRALNRQANNFLSIGIEGGFASSGFNPTLAEMEDPSELFLTQQRTYPLLAAGIAWYYQPTGDFHTKIGLSVRNINQPNITYLQLDDTYLTRRYSLFARAEYRHWQSISLMPVLLFQMQGNYRELVYGADLKWYLQESGSHPTSLRFGIAYRQADALIANLLMEYGAFLFNFCYDANISGLATASNTIGAFEVGMVYRMSKGNKKVKALKCQPY
ncbi:MAG: PorP/SprF family type IX secretion system membrane protein [Bacteroidales bacterium]|nr:PorP/SprF family type IX secretion system membrane protein [Bacteroidales bacterium]